MLLCFPIWDFLWFIRWGCSPVLRPTDNQEFAKLAKRLNHYCRETYCVQPKQGWTVMKEILQERFSVGETLDDTVEITGISEIFQTNQSR